MNTWKIILATMIIFGTGVVTGGLVVATFVQAPKPPRNSNGNRPFASLPGVNRVEFLKKAERELNLTGEQKEKADKIISASQERTRKLMEPVNPQLRQEVQQTKEEFRALLDPNQKARFDEMLKLQNRPREQRHPAPRTNDGPNKQGAEVEASKKE